MDWTIANQIQYSEHNNEIPFVTQIRLPNFPVDDFIIPGVGLAASNHYRFFVPLHGKITKFDVKKVIPKENVIQVKPEQTGFGSPAPEVIEEIQNQIEKEREAKRKLLGDSVFDLMSSPKIKTAKLALVPKEEKKSQKGQGSNAKIHVFKRK
jgi:hypothetical protein